MNLLKNPGRFVYGMATLGAFLCGFLTSITLLVGFAYSGVMGDAPGDPGFTRYSIVAGTGISATIVLFIGLSGTPYNRKVFPILTITGTTSLLLLSVPYAAFAVRGEPLLWTLALIVCELAALCLSCVKLMQLNDLR